MYWFVNTHCPPTHHIHLTRLTPLTVLPMDKNLKDFPFLLPNIVPDYSFFLFGGLQTRHVLFHLPRHDGRFF